MSENKYRKKPVVIEAVQWPPGVEPNEPAWREEPPAWFQEALEAGTIVPFTVKESDWVHLRIKTLEGDHAANPGDFIIRGIKGELYPCKPDIFEATYEPASAPDPSAELAALRQRVGELELTLFRLHESVRDYCKAHDTCGDGSLESGRAWDHMRRSNNDAATALSQPRPAAEGGDGPKQIPCLRNHVDGQTCPCCNNTGWFTPNQNVTVALRDAAAAFGGDDESPSAGQQEGGNNA